MGCGPVRVRRDNIGWGGDIPLNDLVRTCDIMYSKVIVYSEIEDPNSFLGIPREDISVTMTGVSRKLPRNR